MRMAFTRLFHCVTFALCSLSSMADGRPLVTDPTKQQRRLRRHRQDTFELPERGERRKGSHRNSYKPDNTDYPPYLSGFFEYGAEGETDGETEHPTETKHPEETEHPWDYDYYENEHTDEPREYYQYYEIGDPTDEPTLLSGTESPTAFPTYSYGREQVPDDEIVTATDANYGQYYGGGQYVNYAKSKSKASKEKGLHTKQPPYPGYTKKGNKGEETYSESYFENGVETDDYYNEGKEAAYYLHHKSKGKQAFDETPGYPKKGKESYGWQKGKEAPKGQGYIPNKKGHGYIAAKNEYGYVSAEKGGCSRSKGKGGKKNKYSKGYYSSLDGSGLENVGCISSKSKSKGISQSKSKSKRAGKSKSSKSYGTLSSSW